MSRLPTLDGFLTAAARTHLRSAYVRFPGFKYLYVRCNQRFINGAVVGPVIDIANLTARKPGRGAFTKLFQHLRKVYYHYWIYVECVLNPRFEKKLLSLGFIQQDSGLSPCFYMPPAKKDINARRITRNRTPAVG